MNSISNRQFPSYEELNLKLRDHKNLNALNLELIYGVASYFQDKMLTEYLNIEVRKIVLEYPKSLFNDRGSYVAKNYDSSTVAKMISCVLIDIASQKQSE